MSLYTLRLAAALLALAAAAARAEDNPCTLDAYALGLSWHMGDTGYRQTNTGAGIGFSSRLSEQFDLAGMAGVYADSYDKRAVAILVGPRWIAGERTGWHLTAAGMLGRLDGSGHHGVALVPVVGAGHDWIHIEATAMPGVIGAWLRLSWQIVP